MSRKINLTNSRLRQLYAQLKSLAAKKTNTTTSNSGSTTVTNNEYNELKKLIEQNLAKINASNTEIANLKTQLAKIKSCTCSNNTTHTYSGKANFEVQLPTSISFWNNYSSGENIILENTYFKIVFSDRVINLWYKISADDYSQGPIQLKGDNEEWLLDQLVGKDIEIPHPINSTEEIYIHIKFDSYTAAKIVELPITNN